MLTWPRSCWLEEASGDGGSVRNVAQTGTALWYQGSLGTVENIDIRNAAKGIVSYNAAPDIDGFTMSGNDVGIDVYGGMSLPTIYRSPSLAGVSTGWQTYGIDLSGFIGDDYLQVDGIRSGLVGTPIRHTTPTSRKSTRLRTDTESNSPMVRTPGM